MSARDPRDADDLEARLDELEDVLTELRRDLRESERARRGPPRPPRLSELVRFTEQYTIPTVIALLETTIRSLELLQGTLRLADPGRAVGDGRDATTDRLSDVRDGASAGLARSLTELRTALSEADLPEDSASRSIIADARDLTAEIESRIESSREDLDAARTTRQNPQGKKRDTHRRDEDAAEGDTEQGAADNATRGVQIDVTEPADPRVTSDSDDTDHGPSVDVESELASIKRQMEGDEEVDGETAETDASGDVETDASDAVETEAGEGPDASDKEDPDNETNEHGANDDDIDDSAAADR